MQISLAAAPDRLETARRYGLPIAYAAYRIGPEGRLTSLPLPPQLRGGLLMLSDRDAPAFFAPEPLCRDVVLECRRRAAGGVVLDFTSSPSAALVRLVRLLDGELRRQRRSLYVPEEWASYAGSASVLICSAISGGTLRTRLAEAAARFSPRRMALDCQRLAMDFLLPAPNGEGAPLSLPRLEQLRRGRTVYYSEALGARYFTCRAGEQTRFVLFDDADTLRRKLALARELGYAAAFLMLPEVEDLLGELFGQRKQAPSQ